MPILVVSVQKGAVVTLAMFGITGPILIICTYYIATILPLNISELELPMPYSYSFWNASLPNESHFVQNWLPWQRPLRNWKNEVQIDHL